MLTMRLLGLVVISCWALSIAPIILENNQVITGDTAHGWGMISVFFLWPLTGVMTVIFLIASVLSGTRGARDDNNPADLNVGKKSLPTEPKAKITSSRRPRLAKAIVFLSILVGLTVVAIPATMMFDVRLPDALNSSSSYPLAFRLLEQALPIEVFLLVAAIILYAAQRGGEE